MQHWAVPQGATLEVRGLGRAPDQIVALELLLKELLVSCEADKGTATADLPRMPAEHESLS